MTDLLIDQTTGDLSIQNGELSLITDQGVATRQSVLLLLKMFRGEWFRNIDVGVPYIENEFNSVSILNGMTKSEADAYLRQTILSSPEVASIENYSSTLDPSSGRFDLYCKVFYEEGEIEISESLLI